MRNLHPLIAVFSLGWVGCAHPARPAEDPVARARELFARACSPGRNVQEVKGSVWLKVKSKEASGQLPAVVLAQAPRTLRLEVTNLIGGPQALITVRGDEYRIEHEGKVQKGRSSWGGIPLRWALDLFLGRIPCPEGGAPELVTDGEGLRVRGAAEEFRYRFRSWGGKPWPEAVHWEKFGPPKVAVDFEFDDPEDKTESPRKWTAKSAQGEVKVRWKDRETR